MMLRFAMMVSMCLVGTSWTLGAPTDQQEQPERQEESLPPGNSGKRIEKIREYMTEAGQLYLDKDFAASAKKVIQAHRLLVRALENNSAELHPFIAKEHARVARAHEMLTDQGIEMPDLVSMPKEVGQRIHQQGKEPDAMNEEDATSKEVSFRADIAPLLVKHCGRCHVNNDRGEFSMQTFQSLMTAVDGEAVVSGKPEDSLMIQLIEDGSMPPNGQAVPKKDVALIRDWIQQGAHFDGEEADQQTPIHRLDSNRDGGNRRP